MKIRQTHAKIAFTCPRHFKLLAVEGRETPPSHEAAIGTLVHDVIFRYINRCVALGVPNDPGAIPGLTREEFASGPRPPLMPADIPEAVQLAENLTEMLDIPPTVEMTEEPLQLETGGFTFTGRPDCILVAGHAARIYDWKTGRIEHDNEFQHKFYSLLLYRTRPELALFEWQTYFVRGKAVRPQSPGTFTPDELEQFERFLVEWFTAMERNGNYPANPNYLCSWCPGLHDCPVPDAYLPPKSPEQAVDLGRAYLLKAAQAEQVEKQLRQWVTLNGPILTGDAIIGFHGARGTWGIKRAKEGISGANQETGTAELQGTSVDLTDF